ncbi:hypothetical protein GALL_364500 [mine drainage metagenome]|uniref:Uncharacterized protein n=1 Tax=mine drainage metagenome TaxID=410659 RepID=A0A1J5R0U0_9ZZZZ
MKLKKPIASLVSVVLLSIGMATLVTSPASAHTNAVSATCSALSVDLQLYAASREGSPAEGYTEYQWTRTVVDNAAWTEYVRYTYTPKKHGKADPADASSTPLTDPSHWNADNKTYDNSAVDTYIHSGNGEGSWFWWIATTHEAKTHLETKWSKNEPAGDGWVKTGDSRFHETSPAVEAKTNHVAVTIDGTKVENTDFSTTFTKNYPFSDKYTSHTYSVVVTAWDDPMGTHGWTFTKSGSSIACTPPVVQVTAVFPEPVAPTCTTDGALPSLPTDQTGITFSWDENNSLKMVANADKGYVLTGATFNIYEKPGTATGDCYVPLEPVTVAPQTCQVGDGGVADFSGGSITLPTIAGVTYTVKTSGGEPVTITDGKATGLAPGDYTVTALPAEGKILTAGETGWKVGEDGSATITVTVGASADCSVVQPDSKVTSTEWADGTWACDATTVKQTREVTTTPYIWVDGAWVLDTAKAATVTEKQTRDLLASERTVCTEVLAAPPNTVVTIVPPTCTADGSATLANGVGYTWDKTSFGPGLWTATATVADGYAFDNGSTYQVTFLVSPKLTGGACSVSQVLAAPPNSGTFSQVLAAAPNASTAAVLAATGATPLPLAIVAMVLIGAGVVLQPRVRRAIFTRH